MAKKKSSNGQPPGQTDDYLYIISKGKFYRLSPKEVKRNPPIKREGDDIEVFDAMTDLQSKNAVVADLPGADGAGIPASCICVVLNIDIFEGNLQKKVVKS